MRTLRPDMAAAVNTAVRKFSLLTAFEHEKVKGYLQTDFSTLTLSLPGMPGHCAEHRGAQQKQGRSKTIGGRIGRPCGQRYFEGIFCIGGMAGVTREVQFNVLVGQKSMALAGCPRATPVWRSPRIAYTETAGITEHVYSSTLRPLA